MRLHLYIVLLLIGFAGNTAFSQTQDSSGAKLFIGDRFLIAADAGDTIQVEKLIRQGADVDVTTWDGVTALMFATQNGNLAMMHLLIACGADPDKKPANGYTALITAIRNGQPDLAEFLIRNGASVDLADNDKMTPLMHAIVVDSFYMPDLLLYYGALIEPVRRDGMDALMLASWLGRTEIAAGLIELGAPVNLADKNGRTPLHYAAMAGHQDIMELLIAEGASLEARTESGLTPLSMAVLRNNFAAARLLIGYGANINSRISTSMNPLALATENGHDSLSAMLRNNGARVILWPWFNRISFGGHFAFNRDDMLVGINIGLSDKKYNLWTSLGYDIRPKYIRILDPAEGNNYFQYWERRHLISFSMEKAFLFLGTDSHTKGGIVAGFQESMTFGGYRGSYLGPETRLLFSPRVGAVLQNNLLRFRLNYAFMDLQMEDMSKNWYSFSVELLFNRKKGNLKQNTFKGI